MFFSQRCPIVELPRYRSTREPRLVDSKKQSDCRKILTHHERRPFVIPRHTLSIFGGVALLLTSMLAQSSQPGVVKNDMRWRAIGPFRGGRTKAITGVATQPNVFYAGAVNGGVWKSTDYGRTWTPIFDDQPTGSIGAIAVAPSDPNVVYVGSG